MNSVRGRLGIGLFVAAVAAMPFGYWTDTRWYAVAALLGVSGLLLMRSAPRKIGADDLPPGPHELRGFPGARAVVHLRRIDSLCERKPGIFYRGSSAFLHFHEDPAGLFVDVKLGGSHFERMPVSSQRQRSELIAAVREHLSARSGGAHRA